MVGRSFTLEPAERRSTAAAAARPAACATWSSAGSIYHRAGGRHRLQARPDPRRGVRVASRAPSARACTCASRRRSRAGPGGWLADGRRALRDGRRPGRDEARAAPCALLLAGGAGGAQRRRRTAWRCERPLLAASACGSRRERALAAEAVGDAHWMAEQLEDASRGLPRGAGACRGRRARGGRPRPAAVEVGGHADPVAGSMLTDLPERVVRRDRSPGLRRGAGRRRRADRGPAPDRKRARHWRYGSNDRAALEEGLRSGERGACASARDWAGRRSYRRPWTRGRRHAASRWAATREALEMDERRLELVRSLPAGARSRWTSARQAAQTRTARGDFAGAVAAAELGDELGAGSDNRWAAWPARSKVDALFWWDKWDEAIRTYERFVGVLRGTDSDGRRARQSTAGPDARRRRGDPHAARRDRGGRPARAAAAGIEPALRPAMLAHALLGARRGGAGARALDRPAVPAAVGARDQGRVAGPARPLGRLRRGARRHGTRSRASTSCRASSPRSTARAGIAGDEDALARATEAFARLGLRVRARPLPGDRGRRRGGEGGVRPDGRGARGGEGRRADQIRVCGPCPQPPFRPAWARSSWSSSPTTRRRPSRTSRSSPGTGSTTASSSTA